MMILHSRFDADSRAFLAALGLEEPEGDDVTIEVGGQPVRLVSEHVKAVGACPAFPGYPCFVASDGRVLHAPESWAACLEFESAPQAALKQSWSKDELLEAIHWVEKAAIIEAGKTDSLVAAFWDELKMRERPFSRVDLESMIPMLVYRDPPLITEERAAEILGALA